MCEISLACLWHQKQQKSLVWTLVFGRQKTQFTSGSWTGWEIHDLLRALGFVAFFFVDDTENSKTVDFSQVLCVLTVRNLVDRWAWSHHMSGFVFIQHIFWHFKVGVCVCVRVRARVRVWGCVRFLCCCYLFIDFIRFYVFFFSSGAS